MHQSHPHPSHGTCPFTPQPSATTKATLNRRTALRSTLAWAGAAVWTPRIQFAAGFRFPNSRPRIAAIGTGSRWSQKATGIDGAYGSAQDMQRFGDYVAVCDADGDRMANAAKLVAEWTGSEAQQSADYLELITQEHIDIVHISTPDHWHAKIAIEAMQVGKDIYCEKPMTLTIREGQMMRDTRRKNNRVVQIGTQQRSDRAFLTAIALIREGRIGQLRKATCGVGGAPSSPSLPEVQAPTQLDWDRWLGPAPDVPFRYLAGNNGETKSWSRGHYEFRWWYEYSGGKLTDWGAHHVDIATWAMNKTETGPVRIEPLHFKHPVPFVDGYPTDPTQYNTATEFSIRATYADGQELLIQHDGPNGILFEGTEGRIFVNRGRITGKAVDDLTQSSLPDGALEQVYKDRSLVDHFQNFFDACVSRKEPISDVDSHHRALTTCHLAAIAIRLGQPIDWDPTEEKILGNEAQNQFLTRECRQGYEIGLYQ